MLKKRLIGVITVYQNLAVQSFGYNRYLPLGKPECLAENLDRWGVDEIFVQEIDRSYRNLGPNYELIKRIADCDLSTPLLYAGGIKSTNDAVSIIRSGFERVCVNCLLYENPKEVKKMAKILGGQAILAALPLEKNINGIINLYNYISKKNVSYPKKLTEYIDEGIISEAFIIDKNNEGKPDSFDEDLFSLFDGINIPLIPFGGISHSKQIKRLLSNPSVSAVAIGNFLNYKEHSVQSLKRELITTSLRPPFYQSEDN